MNAPNIVGDQDGIDLWSLMSQSTDPIEQAYFVRLNDAASKYGSVWFSDLITQGLKKLNNQASWKMEWNANQAQWKVSLFHLPDGAQKRSPRLIQPQPQEVEWLDVSVDDIIT